MSPTTNNRTIHYKRLFFSKERKKERKNNPKSEKIFGQFEIIDCYKTKKTFFHALLMCSVLVFLVMFLNHMNDDKQQKIR